MSKEIRKNNFAANWPWMNYFVKLGSYFDSILVIVVMIQLATGNLSAALSTFEAILSFGFGFMVGGFTLDLITKGVERHSLNAAPQPVAIDVPTDMSPSRDRGNNEQAI